MILEIMNDMAAFMIVLFIGVIGFAVLMVIARKVDANSLPATVM